MKMLFMKRLEQFGIAVDQLLNTIIGLFHRRGAWADETLSARAWREGQKSDKWLKFRKFVDTIWFWQKDHCQTAYIREQTRMHLAPEYREPEELDDPSP